jgi:hypothetical protein
VKRFLLLLAPLLFLAALARADVGDPQVKSDHPYYPGELSCSTFERLFATQAEMYEKIVGKRPVTDEEKALSAWLWRSTHFYHGEEGRENLFGKGYNDGESIVRTREYWTGLYANGFGICGTTHAQWTAEMEALLGHNRGRVLGVQGHNTFEVYLTGGVYGQGKWVLLDHDQNTVVYDEAGKALLSGKEIADKWSQVTDRKFKIDRQHGWPLCGLDAGDRGTYRQYRTGEYFAGYSGPPPMVHLRRGETLRRYLEPGLADGKTFVFWARNANAGNIPGPERPQTWVNQPEKMYGSKTTVPAKTGQARYGNAVYTYTPDFTTSDYREGIVGETDDQVVFEFTTPYIIGATPAAESATKPWGIYDKGCTNGLIVRGKTPVPVSISVDRGQSWLDAGKLSGSLDLTDAAKGYRQYMLKLGAGAKALRDSGLVITTVCQANPTTMPHLKDGGSTIRFEASQKAVVSAGPNLTQVTGHVVDGKIGSPNVTLELSAPRGSQAVKLYAASHILSSNPPREEIKYQVEMSTDGGKSWKPVVKDWQITRRGEEPKDFWSQSLCWGQTDLPSATTGPVRVRFKNNGGKAFSRPEAHLVYKTGEDRTKVTIAWTDAAGPHTESHVFAGTEPWALPTGRNVQTKWVEFEAVKP